MGQSLDFLVLYFMKIEVGLRVQSFKVFCIISISYVMIMLEACKRPLQGQVRRVTSVMLRLEASLGS